MWSLVSSVFKSYDYILGYEIMAEPRTKIVNQSVVQQFYQGGCDIVHQQDPDTPCIVGPAPFYKAWMLNETLIINGDMNKNKVIYTVDFYVPVNYITSGVQGDQYNDLTYPSVYPCNVALPGWTCAGRGHSPPCFCPDSPTEPVGVNKTWLVSLLTQYPLAFRDKYNLPLLVNQWGMYKQVSAERGGLKYFQDIVDIFNQYKIHSICWVWKWSYPNNAWNGYEIVHNFTSNNTLIVDYNRLDIINSSWNISVHT